MSACRETFLEWFRTRYPRPPEEQAQPSQPANATAYDLDLYDRPAQSDCPAEQYLDSVRFSGYARMEMRNGELVKAAGQEHIPGDAREYWEVSGLQQLNSSHLHAHTCQ